MQAVPHPPPFADAFTVDEPGAERLSGLSGKTLGRLARKGEPVGRIKVGRRVLYVRKQLESWLESQSAGRPAN